MESIWDLVIKRRLGLSTVHIPGTFNREAGELSKKPELRTE